MIGIIMFFTALVLLLFGFPVAFTFGAVSVIFGMIYGLAEVLPFGGTVWEGLQEGVDLFAFMPFRIFAIMKNKILMAIPLFIFMGIVLQKTRLAERLLESMGFLFGEIRGGLAISTVLVGALLAASTGVVGASVVAMGVISLPVMIKHGYRNELSTGSICAAGTLGQIIPPSIVLIILGDVFQVPVGDLFRAAFWPGIFLVLLYVVYILAIAFLRPSVAPPIRRKARSPAKPCKSCGPSGRFSPRSSSLSSSSARSSPGSPPPPSQRPSEPWAPWSSPSSTDSSPSSSSSAPPRKP